MKIYCISIHAQAIGLDIDIGLDVLIFSRF